MTYTFKPNESSSWKKYELKIIRDWKQESKYLNFATITSPKTSYYLYGPKFATCNWNSRQWAITSNFGFTWFLCINDHWITNKQEKCPRESSVVFTETENDTWSKPIRVKNQMLTIHCCCKYTVPDDSNNNGNNNIHNTNN